jgi:hypothetical protein
MIVLVDVVVTVGLVLMAWTVLPLPLAVLVGRAIRTGRVGVPVAAPDRVAPPVAADLCGWI